MSNDPWEHRSSGMTCSTCMWFVEKTGVRFVEKDGRVSGAVVGRCRRHAPSMNGYPAVFPADWCGDHKVDEEKL